jgi:hypothetical protein
VRDCKYGIDPLYTNGDQTARVEGVAYKISRNTTDINNYRYNAYGFSGTYSLKFYDTFGDDYSTIPLAIEADCYTVEDALYGLPNTVIADDSIVCTKTSTLDQQSNLQEVEYALTFRGNPGYLKQLFVDTYLDGDRPTVFPIGDRDVPSPDIQDPVVDIFNTGMTGEYVDFFATQCQHVYGEIKAEASGAGILNGNFRELNSGYYLDLDVVETKLLKQCLGDSDGVADDNVEVYDWDYGSAINLGGAHLMMTSYPHAIKLVQKDPYDDYQGGMYYLTWWESYNKKFILANFPSDVIYDAATNPDFAVFVTDGVVERVIVDAEYAAGDTQSRYSDSAAETDWGDNAKSAGIGELDQYRKGGSTRRGDERVTAYFTKASNMLYTSYDTACETAFFAVEPCLDKGDMLFIIDSNYMSVNYDPAKGTAVKGDGAAAYRETVLYESGNIYSIMKIYKEDPTSTTWATEDRFRIVLDKNIPFAGTETTDFDVKNTTTTRYGKRGVVSLFKFSPATTGNYDFVAPCSNRGICDEGTCECFKGYTDDNCDIQSSLAV